MLCSKPFCQKGDPLTCSGCEPVDLAAARRFCLNADIVVVKIIRLRNLDSLKNIMEDPELDMKVRHHLSLVMMSTSICDHFSAIGYQYKQMRL